MSVVHSVRRIPFAVLIGFLCVAAHEAGHAVAALWFGGHVSEVVLFSWLPHVRVAGHLTAWQTSWTSIGGLAAELILYGGALVLLPLNRLGHLVIEVTGVMTAVELTGWIIACAAYPHVSTGTDVWAFLVNSGVSRVFLLAGCAATVVLGVAGYRKRVRA